MSLDVHDRADGPDDDEDEEDHVLGLRLNEDEDNDDQYEDEEEDEEVEELDHDDLSSVTKKKDIGVGMKQAVGRNRKEFYEQDGDLGWHSDDEEKDLEEEEEEADLMEKEKFESMTTDDYALTSAEPKVCMMSDCMCRFLGEGEG